MEAGRSVGSVEDGERAPLLPGSHNSFNGEGKPIETVNSAEVPKLYPSRAVPVGKAPEGLKTGIGIMLFITFLSSVCFSIVIPSIWQFIQNIEHQSHRNATQSQQGWAVASNSFGSFIASPIIGAWGDRRSTRESLAGTLILMIVGNVMYSLSINFYMLLAARFIVGVACANYSVAQAYISYATNTENRTLVMALNSAANVIGFILGPALALVLNLLNYNVYGVKIDPETSSGYVAALFALFGLFSLFFLREVPATYKKNKNKELSPGSVGSGFYSGQGSIKDVSQIIKMGANKQIPRLAVGVCLFSYFAFTASFTTFETIGTPYTQDAYGWGTNKNGALFAILGVVCVLSLALLQVFLMFFNDRLVVIGTVVLSIGGFGLLLNFHGDHYVSLVRFIAGAVMGSAAYAVGSSVLISIYSKLLENYDQGMMMGWMSSASSVSRIIGPVVCSFTLQYANATIVFTEIIGLTFTMLLLLIIAYRKLDYKPAVSKKSIDGQTINT